MLNRSAGILLAVSSLPSEYGIGCFDENAYRFVDWLKASGQTYWQILPLGPTGYGDSPYQSFSAFAGNPYFISLDEFIKEGLISKKDCEVIVNNPSEVDYQRLYSERFPLLRKAYKNSRGRYSGEIEEFSAENEWLDSYALFMAVKDKHGGIPFTKWEKDLRLRNSRTIEKYTRELSDDIGFYKFLQYHFYEQWFRLRRYANGKGIGIIGDIPIYAAADSADVWAAPQLFQLDESNIPTAVAGCPPDGFSVDGQLWGNPLYNWKKHKESGYSWWIARLAHCFKLYDVVRIDHFRGFDEYYSIPYGDKNARNGHWEKGAGAELFRAVEKALGKKKIIAEDLGFVTDTVRGLVKECGFPGMKVLEFAFDSRDTGSSTDYLPHNYSENCVAYTGTHDNQPVASWFKTITRSEQRAVRDYLYDYYTPDNELYKSLISLIMRSPAGLCIIPMQDWLGLDDEGRMNTPSTVGNNWKWRLKKEEMSAGLSAKIRKITSNYGRRG